MSCTFPENVKVILSQRHIPRPVGHITCVAHGGREVRVQQVQVSMRALLQSLPAGQVWAALGGCQGADGGRHLVVPTLL